ncbi:hypothetical protein CH75_18695 [Dyella jiangningensis]|nr:hypothetical protein CH75_18695 [Dyella jiangningensis]
MRIEKFGLSAEDAKAIVRGCAEGAYSLVTGSGFSLGSSTRLVDVPDAPNAETLAKMLVKAFRLPNVPKSAADLPIVYEDALHEPSGGHDAVIDLFKSALTGLRPKWHHIVAKIPWRRVWTLNIDDLPDSIWSEIKRPVYSTSFDQQYRSIRQTENELQIIYLHGRLVGRQVSDVRVIFSLPEYVNAAANPKSWHEAFFGEFSDQPIIVCGASVAGEFDLSRAFRSGNQSGLSKGMPSLAVVYNMDAAAEHRFKSRFNLIPINVKGEEFFKELTLDVEEYSAAHPLPVVNSASPNDARIFGNQFSFLTDDTGTRISKRIRHDFLAGDEPEWGDIQGQLDAEREAGKRALEYIAAEFATGKSPTVILTGAPGCGKTTALLRTLRDCVRLTETRYLFRGEERIDADAIARCVRADVPAIFGFDLAADFSVDIGVLARALAEKNVQFAMIVADRTKRLRGLSNDLHQLRPLVINASAATNRDANNLYDVRRKNHRLGAYVSKDQRDFRKFVTQKHEGNIFSAMAEVEKGRGFLSRLDHAISADLTDERYIRLAHAISLSHRWGYPLPLRSASVASGLDPTLIGRLCEDDGALADIFTIDRKGVKFRHRVLASHFFSARTDKSLRGEILIRIVETLGPLVTIDAIRGRSYPFLICRVLMDRKGVVEAVGDVGAARIIFEALEPVLGSNSRFWEQRALLESEANDHARAYSYAHEAASRERHTFPLTTLGRVCMAQAVNMGAASPDAALDRFKEGNAALMDARSIARHPEVEGHPFTCFFEYAIKIYSAAAASSGGLSFLSDAWDDWMYEAKRSQAVTDKDIERFQRAWLTKGLKQAMPSQ